MEFNTAFGDISDLFRFISALWLISAEIFYFAALTKINQPFFPKYQRTQKES